MNVAIIGNGKTGSKIHELLSGQNPCVFNTKNRPTVSNLENFDIAIVFVPGNEFLKLIDTLIQSKLPVVTGATGFDWPNDIDQRLKNENLKWIYAQNFSLGMNLIYNMLNVLKHTSNIFDDYNFSLKEIHHTSKLDIPSGTALKWQEWLGEKIDIKSERIGDAVGTHSLTLNLESEEITLTHQAKDRKIFASGAIWAANQLLNDSDLDFGLHEFTELINKKIWSK